MVKISCIVPVYNCDKYLNAMIDSIISQSYKNFELILVDDGSTDDSGSICDSYAIIDKRVRVLHKRNGGVSSARNLGLEKALGEYIIFLDGDDLIARNMFQYLIEDIKSSNSDIAICGFMHCDENSNKNLNVEKKHDAIIYKNPIEKIYEHKYMHQLINKLIKRTIVGNLRFDETINYSEDYLFVTLLMLNCSKVSLREDVLYFYIKHSGSLSWKQGSFDFWNGYVRSKKKILDVFKMKMLPCYLQQEAHKGYCIAIMSLYRFAVHMRDKEMYEEINLMYRHEIKKILKSNNIKFVKKMEYMSFIISYRLAVLFHCK